MKLYQFVLWFACAFGIAYLCIILLDIFIAINTHGGVILREPNRLLLQAEMIVMCIMVVIAIISMLSLVIEFIKSVKEK